MSEQTNKHQRVAMRKTAYESFLRSWKRSTHRYLMDYFDDLSRRETQKEEEEKPTW